MHETTEAEWPTESEFDAAQAEVNAAILETEHTEMPETNPALGEVPIEEGRHPYAECCPICAKRIEAVAAAMNLIYPTISRMAEMFAAIESARETNPMVARLFGLSTEPKESRKDRRRRLSELTEDDEGDEEDAG